MFDFNQKNSWEKITGNDPLGFKRDAAMRDIKINSLLDMNLDSKLSMFDRYELKGAINNNGKIDLIKFGFSSLKNNGDKANSNFFGFPSENLRKDGGVSSPAEIYEIGDNNISYDDVNFDCIAEGTSPHIERYSNIEFHNLDKHDLLHFNEIVAQFYNPIRNPKDVAILDFHED